MDRLACSTPAQNLHRTSPQHGQRRRCPGRLPVMFTTWVENFEAEAARRKRTGDPDWAVGARLHPDVVKSVQRFQVGESGDGANLIAKAGGGTYGEAVRLFVAEEQNHARLLEHLLRAAGQPTISAHWTDAVFVRLRRALGLRLELMVLLIAETGGAAVLPGVAGRQPGPAHRRRRGPHSAGRGAARSVPPGPARPGSPARTSVLVAAVRRGRGDGRA